jgi:3-hydroxybutyryl-CoA dehydrogenase
MGRGIAALCALSGRTTRVYEAHPEVRRSLKGSVEESWSRAVARGKLDAARAAEAAARLTVTETLEVPPDCEFVLEAVPEDLEMKRGLFSALDSLAPEETVLASNTSSLSISAIAASTRRPGRVVGIHFFNPVAAMPLVEIVSGADTSAATRTRAAALVDALGKRAILVKDSPGFATSRLGVALGLEAIRMVEEGVASPGDIDRAMELGYGHRMGPLKTTDLVGLDVRLAIAETLTREVGARFTPPALLRRMVAEGKSGKKTGLGFYRWSGDTPQEIASEEESR